MYPTFSNNNKQEPQEIASYCFYQACIKPLHYRLRFIQWGTLKFLFVLEKAHLLKDFHSISMKYKYVHLHYTPSQLNPNFILYCANNITCLNKWISNFALLSGILVVRICIYGNTMVLWHKLWVTERYLWCKMTARPIPLTEKNWHVNTNFFLNALYLEPYWCRPT